MRSKIILIILILLGFQCNAQNFNQSCRRLIQGFDYSSEYTAELNIGEEFIKTIDSDNINGLNITSDHNINKQSGYPTYENLKVFLMQDSTYKGHDIKYYKRHFRMATAQQGFGVFFTSMCFLAEIGGIVVLINSDNINEANESNNSPDADIIASGLLAGGAVLASVGIPLLVSGSIKRANNRKAIEEIERNSSLTMGLTKNGIGLIIRF